MNTTPIPQKSSAEWSPRKHYQRLVAAERRERDIERKIARRMKRLFAAR